MATWSRLQRRWQNPGYARQAEYRQRQARWTVILRQAVNLEVASVKQV